MKSLVMATLIFCFNTGECSQKQVQIESKVCSIGKVDAQFRHPQTGEWAPGTATVRC
jgi:hypothetical protein